MKKLCTVLLLSAMFCTLFTACGKKAESDVSPNASPIISLSDFDTVQKNFEEISFTIPKDWTSKTDENGILFFYSAQNHYMVFQKQILKIDDSTIDSYVNGMVEKLGSEVKSQSEVTIDGVPAYYVQTAFFPDKVTPMPIHFVGFQNGDAFFSVMLSKTAGDNSEDLSTLFNDITQSIKINQTVKVTPSPTPEPTPKKTVYKAGMYKVGADIGAGEYFLTSTGSGYYSLNSDSSGSFDSILENDNFKNSAYITVSDGQYLELSNCTMIAAGDAEPQKPVNGTYPSGMYKVGYEIPAGEYKLKPTSSSGYYARLSKASSSLDAIIANDNFSGEIYLTIKDGEYLKLSNCVLIIQ